MAPQTSIPAAANVLGTIGTVCWSIQLLPQIYRSYRTKSTVGVPPLMMLFWSISGVPFGAYAIAQNFNIPIQIQPQCFCLFCLVNWGQCKYYSSKWKARHVIMICTAILVVDAGLQGLLVWLLRKGYHKKHLEWPMTLVGSLAFVLLISGYIPIPFELVKRRGRVVGIDLWFLTIDWLGAFFSLMSLVVQNTFDPLFGTLYAACIEMSMFISHGIWLLRTRRLRKKCKEAGLEFDLHPEAVQWQSSGFKVSWSRTSSTQESDHTSHQVGDVAPDAPAREKESPATIVPERPDEVV
ncbi:PQ loop repeat-domain-containing protein [Exophiala viscosa]|uniref:PQ loop repeat-domain-containing protein n=1 Tax=Exophiala viscosa TaxID=2486360 RepID=A0AAN6DPM7_9EURO|nr:PQ loop repeat-domain-containing protein [Exophiala viscosa]KAI1628957.1 PQ loop repeat-domain-containing protein [Exophiala viscosa]